MLCQTWAKESLDWGKYVICTSLVNLQAPVWVKLTAWHFQVSKAEDKPSTGGEWHFISSVSLILQLCVLSFSHSPFVSVSSPASMNSHLLLFPFAPVSAPLKYEITDCVWDNRWSEVVGWGQGVRWSNFGPSRTASSDNLVLSQTEMVIIFIDGLPGHPQAEPLFTAWFNTAALFSPQTRAGVCQWSGEPLEIYKTSIYEWGCPFCCLLGDPHTHYSTSSKGSGPGNARHVAPVCWQLLHARG